MLTITCVFSLVLFYFYIKRDSLKEKQTDNIEDVAKAKKNKK